MISFIKKALSCPYAAFMFMGIIAALALIMALVAQYAFGLAPCNLCVIQRYPYGIVIALSAFGLLMAKKSIRISVISMCLIGVTFLANSVIAFYHTGVEQKWWESFLQGCAVPKLSDNIEEMMAQIKATTEVVRCDEIPWSDPIFNLSMANYNVLFCAGLGVIALYAARQIWVSRNAISPHKK